jgi:hypothetical protein
MAIGDIIAVGPSDEFKVDSSGNATVAGTLTATGTVTFSGLTQQAVTIVDMANAAHALVTGTAGAAETKLVTNLVSVDPNGGAQVLTLPAEANFTGMIYISNAADAAEAVTVKDDAAATIITLDQAQSGIVVCDGTAWSGFMGAIT